MKHWLTLLFFIIGLQLYCQFPTYSGGNADGNSSIALMPGSYNSFLGGTSDGVAITTAPSANNFNLFNGGNNDGFSNTKSLLTNPFSLFKGNWGDGFAVGIGVPQVPIDIFKGGLNDGFARVKIDAATTFNFFSGSVNDGSGTAIISAPNNFTVFSGGNQDGVATIKFNNATTFTLFNGGLNDGFARGRLQPCFSITGVTANITSITTTTANFNWTAINEGAEYSIKVYAAGNPTVLQNNTGITSSGLNTVPLSALAPNTSYCVTVEENCDASHSSGVSSQFCFTTASGGNCAVPTNQGIYVATGPMLIVKWLSPLYGNTSKAYQVAGGMNIGSPAQATIVQSNPYYISQTPQHPTHSFYGGNTPGFTWYVRDICNPGDTSAWLGPYIVGASKTDGSETTAITEDEEQNSSATLVVYPNPNADGRLFIKAMDISDNTRLLIYTAQGQLALQTTIVNKTVDVSALSNGVYMLRIETPAYNTQLKKLVIQH